MSSNQTSRFSRQTSSATRVLQTRFYAARKLPHPDETWTTADERIDDIVFPNIMSFRFHGIIQPVGHKMKDGNRRRVYRTGPAAWQVIQTIDERRDPLPGPCEHTGVRNLGDGKYTCTNDDCTARFDRATARERLE